MSLGAKGALHFFLGGHDLEMLEIRRLLETQARHSFTDKTLPWGAKFSDYREEIQATFEAGETPAVIELADDMPLDWPPRTTMIVVDHHGERAGSDQPSSLEQVFNLLDLHRSAWTRRHMLVAANDIGHVAGLSAAGASLDEIREIRAADRQAQGVTQADEAEAARAIAAREVSGSLTVVRTTSHTSSAIADLLLPELGGPGYDNLLVLMQNKVAFFGDGSIVKALAHETPGSWHGGALPERGFWGTHVQSESGKQALYERVARLSR